MDHEEIRVSTTDSTPMPTPKPEKKCSTPLYIIIILLLLATNAYTAYMLLFTEKEEIATTQESLTEQEITTPDYNTTEPFAEEENEDENEIQELQTAKIGEPVDLGDYEVTILQILDPNEEATMEIMDGYKFVAVEVLLENKTNAAEFYRSDLTLFDENGFSYTAFAKKEPSFPTEGEISANGAKKGWLNFRTTKDATGFTLKSLQNNFSIEFVQ